MTTNVHNVAVFGGANPQVVSAPVGTPPAGAAKIEAFNTFSLGGGGVNVSTVLTLLGCRTDLYVITMHPDYLDDDGELFEHMLRRHTDRLVQDGGSLIVRHVPLLRRMPSAVILASALFGDHGEYDPARIERTEANFTHALPGVRVLTTARRVSAKLGHRFLTVGNPSLRVLVCSGLDLFADRKATELILGVSDLVFLNETEAENLAQCLEASDPAEVAHSYPTTFICTSDRVSGQNRLLIGGQSEVRFSNGVEGPAADPAGAGDAFAGTVLATALRYASSPDQLVIDERVVAAGARAGKIVAMQRGSLAPDNLRELIGEL